MIGFKFEKEENENKYSKSVVLNQKNFDYLADLWQAMCIKLFDKQITLKPATILYITNKISTLLSLCENKTCVINICVLVELSCV